MKLFKGIAVDSVYLAITKLITTMGGILATKILSVSLSLDEYGTYSQAIVLSSFFASIISFGLSDCVIYFFNGKKNKRTEKEQIINTIFGFELVLGILTILVVFIGKNWIVNYFSNAKLAVLLFFVGIKPAFENLLYMYQVLFVSIGKAKVIALRNLILSFGKILGIYIAAHLIHDLQAIMFVLIILDLIQLLLFHWIFSEKAFRINPLKGNIRWLSKILGYGIPMGIYAITNVLTRDIDKFVVGYFAKTEDLAIYNNCSKVLPFDILALSLATVLIPHIVRLAGEKDKTAAIALFKNYLKVGYYSVWILAGAVIVVSDLAIPFLYSSEYVGGKSIFILYIFDSMLRFASIHLVLTAVGKTKKLMSYSLISLSINTVLNVLLYYGIGLAGPAVATLISAVIYTGLVLNATTKELDTKILYVFDWREIFGFILKLLISGVLLNLIKEMILRLGWNYIVVLFLVAGSYVFVNLILNYKKIKILWLSFNKEAFKSAQ